MSEYKYYPVQQSPEPDFEAVKQAWEKEGRMFGLRNPNHHPKLKEAKRYALQEKVGKEWSRCPIECTTTLNPKSAKIFGGRYLNTTVWDWSLSFDAVPLEKLV